MAVQKSRKSRARRGMRRSHHRLNMPALVEDSMTGEIHRRHHLTPDGFYRGAQVLKPKDIVHESEE